MRLAALLFGVTRSLLDLRFGRRQEFWQCSDTAHPSATSPPQGHFSSVAPTATPTALAAPTSTLDPAGATGDLGVTPAPADVVDLGDFGALLVDTVFSTFLIGIVVALGV